MAPSSMSPKQRLPIVVLLTLAALAVAASPAAAQQQQQPQEYCRDSLAGLMECQSFMHGAAAASPACCAAYEAAFDADPFCLCYVADGTFARATGTVVDVARALQIPISCGQAAPPVELCNMQGIVLPPYEPKGAVAAAPEAFRNAAVVHHFAVTAITNLCCRSYFHNTSDHDHHGRRGGRSHGLKFAVGSDLNAT
ncbi:hypothetical protein EJB05_27467, partial [Eragrostis curvula]